MQIVKYEINKNILTVGFKEVDTKGNPFVVFTQIAYDSTLTKQQLLQKAYIRVKNTIDYEKTQIDHTITTELIGDEFIPDVPKATTIDIGNALTYFECLKEGNITNQYTAKVYDQYGNVMDKQATFTLNNTPTNISISNGLITIGQADNDYELILTTECEGATSSLTVTIKKYMEPIINNTPTFENRLKATEDAIATLMGV